MIRLATLGQQSFWLDEGYTERLVRMSFGAMLHAIPRTESTPPVYYAAAWLWTRAFGFSELGLRSLSAVAGIATVPVACAVARRLAGTRTAAIAGLLVAVSPLLVWFSQEARAYALAALLAAVTLLCTVGWLQENRRGWLVGWAVAAALGLATHYFVVFAVAPELVLLWWRARARAERDLALASALVLAVAGALVPLALAQRGTGHADYIAQGDLATRLLQVPKQLLVGYASPLQGLTTGLAAVLVAAGAAWPILTAARIRRRARVPLAIGVAGVLAPVALALVGIDFLNTRNLLPMLPALCVAAAVGFAGRRHPGEPLPGRRVRSALAGALALVLIAVVCLVDATPRYQRADWRDAATALGASASTRAIVVTPGSGLIPLQAYLPRLRAMTGAEAVRELDVIALGAQRVGGGIGPPPRPQGVPAGGFRLVRAVYGSTYTTLRYLSPHPVVLSPAAVANDRLAEPGAGVAALVQLGHAPSGADG